MYPGISKHLDLIAAAMIQTLNSWDDVFDDNFRVFRVFHSVKLALKKENTPAPTIIIHNNSSKKFILKGFNPSGWSFLLNLAPFKNTTIPRASQMEEAKRRSDLIRRLGSELIMMAHSCERHWLFLKLVVQWLDILPMPSAEESRLSRIKKKMIRRHERAPLPSDGKFQEGYLIKKKILRDDELKIEMAKILKDFIEVYHGPAVQKAVGTLPLTPEQLTFASPMFDYMENHDGHAERCFRLLEQIDMPKQTRREINLANAILEKGQDPEGEFDEHLEAIAANLSKTFDFRLANARCRPDVKENLKRKTPYPAAPGSPPARPSASSMRREKKAPYSEKKA